MNHSKIVGGSTAARVINCPGSVGLIDSLPPMPEQVSEYAEEGTRLHAEVAELIEQNLPVPENADEKLVQAIDMFDEYLTALEDEQGDTATILCEQTVSFGTIKGVPDEIFGSCDVILRCGQRVVILDWKFGDGVRVSAEDNSQLMFYAAAAMRTESTTHLFKDATEIDLVIIQPVQGAPSVWQTTLPRIAKFEKDLMAAVKKALGKNPPLKEGSHCRWCKAKAVCPLMTGAMQRAVKADLSKLDVTTLGQAVEQSYLLEQWIKDLRQLVQTAIEHGTPVPGCKLVAKRGRREWVNEEKMIDAMLGEGLTLADITKEEFLSPAQVEKVLKKRGLAFPDGLVATVSSGHTLALESDPRPAVDDMAELGEALKQIS